MIENADLPHLLAAINMTTVVVLVAGWRFIRAGNRDAHKKCMAAALALGVTFLVIYLYYHANSGLARFGGQGAVRYVYFTILIIHVLCAMIAAIAIPVTAFFAIRGRYAAHRKIARRAMPLWLFVSASGVIIYIMAVHIYPWGGT